MSHSLERDLKLVSLGAFRRRLVELFSFDAEYLRRLRAGESAVEEHFVDYFGRLLMVKLRARGVPMTAAADIAQETFLRVLRTLHSPTGVHTPHALGAFVNSTCNNVLLEQYRSTERYQALDDNYGDSPSGDRGIEETLVTNETRHAVREVLDTLPSKDARLLRAIFVDERPKDEVCATFGVGRDYLRVLLHRAKEQFRRRYLDRTGGEMLRVKGEGR